MPTLGLKEAPCVICLPAFSFGCVLCSGMSIVLAVAEGEVFVNDAEIQKSALQVIINCVCAPDKRMSSIGKFMAGSPRRRLPQQTKANESVLTQMWNVVQSNNGIKVERAGGLKDAGLLRAPAHPLFSCLKRPRCCCPC